MTDLTSSVTSELDALVRAVPGVAQLYRRSALTDALARTAAHAAHMTAAALPFVRADITIARIG